MFVWCWPVQGCGVGQVGRDFFFWRLIMTRGGERSFSWWRDRPFLISVNHEITKLFPVNRDWKSPRDSWLRKVKHRSSWFGVFILRDCEDFLQFVIKSPKIHFLSWCIVFIFRESWIGLVSRESWFGKIIFRDSWSDPPFTPLQKGEIRSKDPTVDASWTLKNSYSIYIIQIWYM